MKPAPSGLVKEADHRTHDPALHLSANKLDVYGYERLAYTEKPMPASATPPISKRASAFLKAMRYWVLSRF